MQACTYLNVVAGAALIAAWSFAACGGSQSPASAPSAEPVASAAPADIGTSAPAQSPPSASSATASPSLAASPPSAAPERSKEDLMAIISGNRDAFRVCYDASAKKHPGIKGRFVLNFVLNPDGKVKSAAADPTKSEIHASDLETCAIDVLKSLKFPPSKKGFESTVSYPFDFNPKGPPPKTGAP
jgi:TonB family protein